MVLPINGGKLPGSNLGSTPHPCLSIWSWPSNRVATVEAQDRLRTKRIPEATFFVVDSVLFLQIKLQAGTSGGAGCSYRRQAVPESPAMQRNAAFQVFQIINKVIS